MLRIDSKSTRYLNKIKIDKEILKRILLIGIPTGLQSVLVCFSNIIVQSKVNLFGFILDTLGMKL